MINNFKPINNFLFPGTNAQSSNDDQQQTAETEQPQRRRQPPALNQTERGGHPHQHTLAWPHFQLRISNGGRHRPHARQHATDSILQHATAQHTGQCGRFEFARLSNTSQIGQFIIEGDRFVDPSGSFVEDDDF